MTQHCECESIKCSHHGEGCHYRQEITLITIFGRFLVCEACWEFWHEDSVARTFLKEDTK